MLSIPLELLVAIVLCYAAVIAGIFLTWLDDDDETETSVSLDLTDVTA